MIRGDTVTSTILAAKGNKIKYFRYPYLSTGSTDTSKMAVEQFLLAHHYINAPVTLEAADWWFATIYSKAKKRNDTNVMEQIVRGYLARTKEMCDYYERMSIAVNGRPMRQILLIHANQLNADHFDELVAVFKERGYNFISLAHALKDPAYDQADTYVGSGGETWLRQWCQSRKPPISFAAEPEISGPLKQLEAAMDIKP